MKLKKIAVLVLISLIFASAASAAYRAPARRSPTMFQKGGMLFTPQFVVIYHTTCLGGNFEYFITPVISLGGDLVGTLDSPTVMIFSPDVAYHLDLKVENLDVFAGAGPAIAFAVKGGGGSEFGFKPFAGGRYFFTPKLAGYVKVLAFISSDSSFGVAFGVTIKL